MYRDNSEGSSSDGSDHGGISLSNQMIQRQFADRYEAMKSHYEQRIVQLSEVIQDTCMSLCSDELLASMKQDATSSAFMPAHISEILNVHIDAERERYLHDMVQQVSSLEAQNRTLRDKTEKQHLKITHLEAENHAGRKAMTQVDLLAEKSRQLEQQCALLGESRADEGEQLRGRIAAVERERDMVESKSAHAERALEERTAANERLRRQSESQATEIRQLESTVEQLGRDLAIIESVDAQEQQLKAELKEQLRQMGAERESLIAELGDVRSQLRYAEAEVGRLEAVEIDKDQALGNARSKQTQLMQQVESMLASEAEESNAAINAVHEKMKELRHKLFTELTKEKRHSSAISEELSALREFKDEKTRELRNAVEDEVMLREKLQREVRKVQEMSKQLQEEAAMTKDARMRRHEAEVLARYAQDTAVMLEKKIAELELRHKEELLAAEEAARLRAGQTHDQSVIELRSEAYRLHYQNQFHESHANAAIGGAGNPMRHSYSGLPSVPIEGGGGGNVAHLEAALRTAKETWSKERTQLEQSVTQYIMKTEKLQSELDMAQRKVQLQAAEQEEAANEAQKTQAREAAAVAAQHAHDQDLLRARLDEAGRNIDKLKNMVIEKKRQIDWLQMEMQRTQQTLSDEVDQVQREGNLDHGIEEARIKEQQLQIESLQAALKAAEESTATHHNLGEEARNEAAKEKLRAAEFQVHAQSLQEQLQHTQKVALEEQAADRAMLMDMKGKFDALMQQYSKIEGSQAAAGGAGAEAGAEHGAGEEKDQEIARLRAQLAQAAAAVAANAPSNTRMQEKDDASQSSAGSVSSAAKALAHRDAKLAQSRKDISALEVQLATYRQKMTEMAAQLGDSRRSSQRSASKVSNNGEAPAKLAEALQQLAQLRDELQRRDIEAERTEHLHERQISELRQAQEAALLSARQSGPALNAFTPERERKASKFSPGTEAAGATHTDWGNTGSRNTRSSAYETATKALLDALVQAQMIDTVLALDIDRLAASTQHAASSATAGQAVQSKLEGALERYKAEYQAALSITINESEALQLRVSDLEAQLRHARAGAGAGGGRGLNSSHYDEALSVDADSSRGGGGSALQELEQSRHEHALLVELTKLEGDARTKMLLAQMKDLQKRHAVEVERLQADKREELNVQKGTNETRLSGLLEEIRSLKHTIAFQADSLSEASQTRSFTVDTKLQIEKNRRKELIQQFEQIEEQHRVTIEELESANLVLEQRCERAELQVTRLKMELLAAGGGAGGGGGRKEKENGVSTPSRRKEEKKEKKENGEVQSLPHYMTSLSSDVDAGGAPSTTPPQGKNSPPRSSTIKREA